MLRQCRLPDKEEAAKMEEMEERKRKKGGEGGWWEGWDTIVRIIFDQRVAGKLKFRIISELSK